MNREGTVASKVRTRIERIRYKHKQSHRQYRKQVLRDKAHLKYLSELHEEYILVPADKAGNNVIRSCLLWYNSRILWKALQMLSYVFCTSTANKNYRGDLRPHFQAHIHVSL